MKEPPRSDEERELARLTEAAAAGDRSAVDALLEGLLPDLRAFIRLRTGATIRRQEATSDVVQSVCREVLTKADQFRFAGEGAFRSWLFTTALRKLSAKRDHWTAERRDPTSEVTGDEDDFSLLAAYSRIATPSRHAELREDLARIEEAILELGEEDRSIILMTRLVGLSQAQIAEELGLTEGAVRMRLHRALAKLAVLLDP